MQYSIIVAHDMLDGIGKNGKIPWTIPEDMKHFRETTENHVVIMGGKTYSSLSKREPLKNRTNIVISKKQLDLIKSYNEYLSEYKSLWYDGFLFVDSPETACKVCEVISSTKKVFVIGGAQIYNWFLQKNLICEVIQSYIYDNYECNTFLDINRYLKYGFKLQSKKIFNSFDIKVWKNDRCL